METLEAQRTPTHIGGSMRCPRCNSCESMWDTSPCKHCAYPGEDIRGRKIRAQDDIEKEEFYKDPMEENSPMITVTVVFNVEDIRKLDFLEDFDVPYYAENENLPRKYKALQMRMDNIKGIVDEE